MSSFEGVLVSDQWLQSQFTQVELRSLKSRVSLDVLGIRSIAFEIVLLMFNCDEMHVLLQFISAKNQNGKVTTGDLPHIMMKLKAFKERHSEEEIRGILSESDPQLSDEIDFESFLRVSLFSVYILFHLFFFFFPFLKQVFEYGTT